MSDTPIYDKVFKAHFAVCGSTGPRIGEDGSPRCALSLGHVGMHRGFQGSGFEREYWGAPIHRDLQFVRDWADAGRLPDKLK